MGLGLKGLKGKGTEATPHKNKVEYLAQNHKTLKQTFFKSVRWYEIIHGCIKCEVVKEKNMSKYQIISICQRLINIINCALEGASLTTKQATVKKKCVFVSISKPQEQNGPRKSWKLCLNLCSRQFCDIGIRYWPRIYFNEY